MNQENDPRLEEEGTNQEKATEEAVFPLEKYDSKSWMKSFFLGAFLGLAIVVPGISGSAVAIIFHLYDKLIYAFANILKRFKSCFLFLLPIALGAILGFAIGFLLVKVLLELIPFGIIGYFAGLMVGALPSVLKELDGDKLTTKKTVLMGLGIVVPLLVGALAVTLTWFGQDPEFTYGITNGLSTGEEVIDTGIFGDFPWWIYIVAIPIGLFLGFSQVIPGLSATAFLMLIGFFTPLVDSVDPDFWAAYPQIFAFYVIMGVSLLVGFVLTSKLMTKLFSWNRNVVYRFIVGMSIGSILAMFLNPDTLSVYRSWAVGFAEGGMGTIGFFGLDFTVPLKPLMITDIALCVPLMVGGYFSSNLLVKYGEKHQ